MDKVYDVIIAGGGSAGLSAALYAARAKLEVIVIESYKEGGQINLASVVDNYPGGLSGEDGLALSTRMVEQCSNAGVEFLNAEITKYMISGSIKKVYASDMEIYARTIILATGRRAVSLGVPGEQEYVGRGVSYCATCDGPFYSGVDVVVIGGGDSAIEEASCLTKYVRKVTVIHRRDTFRAAKSLLEKAISNEKIEFLLNSRIIEISGDDFVETVTVQNTITGEISTVGITGDDWALGVFIFIGHTPNTEPLEGLIDMEGGYIITDEEMRTNIPGVFAVGDIRKKSLYQVVTAVADGAIAAVNADKYIDAAKENKWEEESFQNNSTAATV